MHILLVVLSTLLQLLYLLALFHLAVGFLNATQLLSSGDPKVLAGTTSSAIVKSIIVVIPSLIGLLLGLYLVKNSPKQTPNWFNLFSKSMSYMWLFFIPVGTLLGAWQLRLLKHAT
jgi:ABC-type transport system involved in multi-copper enzyme maturation permease subunit